MSDDNREVHHHHHSGGGGPFLPFVVGGLVVAALVVGVLIYSGTIQFGQQPASDVDVTIESPVDEGAPALEEGGEVVPEPDDEG